MKNFLILLIVLFLSFLIQSCTLDVSWTLNFYNQMSSTVYEIYCNESSSSTWGSAVYNGSISSGSYASITMSSPEGSHDIRWEDAT